MLNLDTLTDQVIKYLRTNEVLAGEPLFTRTIAKLVCVDPKGEWDEYYLQPPYWQTRQIDVHKRDFEAIDSKLARTSYDLVVEELERDIPDSEDTVIIDIGCRYGILGGGYLAQKKPNSKVVLVSKSEPVLDDLDRPDSVFPEYLFITPPTSQRKRHKLVFNTGREIIRAERDMETRVRKLYDANGFRNVEYYDREILAESPDSEILPEFLRSHRGKRIYVFSHNIPRDVAFIAANVYRALDAQTLDVAPTAQSKTARDSFSWKIVKNNLALSDDELAGLIESTLDKPTDTSLEGRYPYDNQGHHEPGKRIGVTIKLALAVALAKQVSGSVLRNSDLSYLGWNQVDHFVRARRTDAIRRD